VTSVFLFNPRPRATFRGNASFSYGSASTSPNGFGAVFRCAPFGSLEMIRFEWKRSGHAEWNASSCRIAWVTVRHGHDGRASSSAELAQSGHMPNFRDATRALGRHVHVPSAMAHDVRPRLVAILRTRPAGFAAPRVDGSARPDEEKPDALMPVLAT